MRRIRAIAVVAGVSLVAVMSFATTLPAAAAPGTTGPRIDATLAGSGASTVDFVIGHPIFREDSSGTAQGSLIGRAAYTLNVGFTGIVRGITLTITTHSGTLSADALYPFIPVVGTPLDIVSGTGRFSHATGTITIDSLTRTNQVCTPSPPAPSPDLFCTWDETATISSAISLH